MAKFKPEFKVRGRRGLPAGSGHLTGNFRLTGRRFCVRSNACGIDALYDGHGDAFGIIVRVDSKEPLVVLRLGSFLSECRIRRQAEP